MMKKAILTEVERLKKEGGLQTQSQKIHIAISLSDTEAKEWFEQQPDKGKYLKKLILNDKKKKLGD